MVTVYEMFTELGRISARFSARLVHAGAINALEDLAALALAREPMRVKVGAMALLDKASVECLATFGRSIPQVTAAVSACCG